jgi:hypothetical protein
VESVIGKQSEPGSGNNFPGVYGVVLVSVCNFCPVQGPCGWGVSESGSSFEPEQLRVQEANVSESMMANESLDEPCRALGEENESGRWTMCIFFCARAFLNETRKQKENGVSGRETLIGTVILTVSRICLVQSVSVVLVNESSCVLGPSCEREIENGLNNLSSSSSWTRYYCG